MDNEEEYNDSFEEFYERVTNKRSFLLEIYGGNVVPIFNPDFYDKISISLFDNGYSKESEVLIKKKEYRVDENTFEEIKQLVIDNFDRLIDITKKQTTESYDGSYSNFLLKINSILLCISPYNIKDDEDLNFTRELMSKIISKLSVESNIIKTYKFDQENRNWIIE